MDENDEWRFCINSYANYLKLRDAASSVKVIEMIDGNLQRLRNKYPNQSKIFDLMDRQV